jgi:hypothetical protein
MIDTPVRDLLDGVLDDEPAMPDAAVAVFTQADRLRKRRRRRVLLTATAVVVLVAFTGNALTELIVPTVVPKISADPTATPAASAPGVSAPEATASGVTASGAPGASAAAAASDPLLAFSATLLAPSGSQLRPNATGEGWSRYDVVDSGEVTGTLEYVLYSTTAGLCLPPTPTPSDRCVRMALRNDVRYYTYEDPDAGFAELIGVRQKDSRAFAVQSRGLDGDAAPLTVTELKRLALDRGLATQLDDDEWCDRPDASCPELGVPVPPEDSD